MYSVSSGSSVRWWPDIYGRDYDGEWSKDPTSGETNRYVRLTPAVWLVWTRTQSRRQQNLYYGRLYGGLEAVTANPLGIDPASQVFQPASLPYNLIRSATNTLVAKVAKARPIPMYLPVGGDHRIQKRTRLLNRFVAGLFHKHRAHARGYLATRDAALYGTGMLLVQPDRRKVSVEPLFPWEVHVDPVDARYGDPKSLYLVRYLDKDTLKARFPNKAEAIETAPVLDESFFPIQDVFSVSTRCTVIEAWHLRSGPGCKDGRHSICLLNDDLLDEQYDFDEYPIVRLMKDAPLAGWWGLGIGDEMSAFQDEKNQMADRVHYSHRIVGGQVWLVPDGGGMLDTDFNDEIGVVARYAGGPAMKPDCVNPDPINPQTYQYFNDIDVHAYGYSGISSMSAQSQKPAGVTAALALQTLDDMETDRFSMFERAHEEFYVDLGRHMLRCVRQIADKYGDFKVFSANKGSGQEIMWKRDVDLEEDSYIVQSWPTSLLPKTPAAKLQRVIELSTNQIFDRAQVLKMLELPDTTTEERLLLAPREAAEAQIALILESDDPMADENYIPPGKYQDLSYSMSRAQQEYNLLQADAIDRGTINDPDIIARLSNLAQYMKQCSDALDDAKQQAAMQAAAAQSAPGMTSGGPQMAAAPAPVSASMGAPTPAGPPTPTPPTGQ